MAVETVRTRILGAVIPRTPDGLPARVWFSVLCDLFIQGWQVRWRDSKLAIRSPDPLAHDPLAEKERVRAGHLIERDRNKSEETTRRFVKEMEASRLHGNAWHSIFSLFRDGNTLARDLEAVALAASDNPDDSLRRIIDPYIQIAEPGSVCEYTGLHLNDIWRYFRLTWSTMPQSVPGRRMLVLVRDRAASNHPVIGIAALGSAVVQLGVRDKWIGWTSDLFLKWLSSNCTRANAAWLLRCVDDAIADVFHRDFVTEGLVTSGELKSPTTGVISRLREEALRSRAAHERYSRNGGHKAAAARPDRTDWKQQAQTFLFRSKRATALANALEARSVLKALGLSEPSAKALHKVLLAPSGQRSLAGLLRYLKARHVGIDMADITVCGAVPPYTHILGGKLVSLLLGSPEIVEAYRRKYANAVSLIASGVKGASVRRRPNLVLLGTTSLYGVSSSQYNRLAVPRAALGAQSAGDLRFIELGRSVGFGSYQFTQGTIEEMNDLAQQRRGGRRVNSIFGEGVNPKLRKIREALDQCGFPSDELLRHGSPRLVYAVPLADNLREILLGRAKRPRWMIRTTTTKEGTELISSFWRRRWLSGRIRSPEVLAKVAAHSTARPVRHGARVRLSEDELGLPLFTGPE